MIKLRSEIGCQKKPAKKKEPEGSNVSFLKNGYCYNRISIHAPVWGTTEHYCPACGLIGSHAVPNIPLVIEPITYPTGYRTDNGPHF